MVAARKILIIAGPNGAGKSMFAREFLPNDAECPIFVNADLIAAGLSPFQPELAAIKAGELMRSRSMSSAEGDSILPTPMPVSISSNGQGCDEAPVTAG